LSPLLNSSAVYPRTRM